MFSQSTIDLHSVATTHSHSTGPCFKDSSSVEPLKCIHQQLYSAGTKRTSDLGLSSDSAIDSSPRGSYPVPSRGRETIRHTPLVIVSCGVPVMARRRPATQTRTALMTPAVRVPIYRSAVDQLSIPYSANLACFIRAHNSRFAESLDRVKISDQRVFLRHFAHA